MKKAKKSKTSLVKEHLLSKGSISTWEAIKLYRATRLAAIIFTLRDKSGLNIKTEMIEDKDSTYAKYVLISTPKKSK